MSDVTTIKVPKSVRDRLQRIAVTRGLTMAQALGELLDSEGARPKPTVGGYRSGRPMSAQEIDRELGEGFGA